MKYLLSLLCLFFMTAHHGFSQNKSGAITYKIRMADDFSKFHDTVGQKDFLKRHFLKEYTALKKTVPFLTHTVDFNDKGALSKTEKVMDNDAGYSIRKAKMATYTDRQYYFNFAENSSTQQVKNFGKTLRIKRFSDSINWTIKNEHKEILGYKCQKATADYSFNFLVENKITAWFAPALPFHMGPIGIAGLPGTILEVEKKGIFFKADKINLKTTPKIDPPEKGDLINAHDYQKMIMKNDPRVKQFMEKQKKD